MNQKQLNIPFAPPMIGDEEIAEVVDSLRSGWITTGPKVKKFERLFAEYTGAAHAVATFSCTAAMHVSLIALGVKPGDEIITTPFTFASTAHVILWCGAEPVFVDIDPATFQIDVAAVEKAISPKTKFLMPVHYGGNTADLDALMSLAQKHGLTIIEDAAHAAGAGYSGRKIGSFGAASCFSFYATKNMTTAEGGMITTDDDAAAERMRKLTMYGISDAREIWKRHAPRGNWFYDIEMIGQKCNMTDICAAMGIHQLAKLDGFNAVRKKHAAFYINIFQGTGCQFMRPTNNADCVWHVFPLLLPRGIDRDKFIASLNQKGIGTSVLFRPLHLHKAYREILGHCEGGFPVAEDVYNRLICLPISPAVGEADIARIADEVNEQLLADKVSAGDDGGTRKDCS